MSQNIIQKFINKIFKPRLETVATTTVPLLPLNEEGENEEIRKLVIDYLVNKHGQKNAEEIVNNGSWTVVNNLILDYIAITVYEKNEKYFCSFWFDGEKLEKLEDRIDENSEIGKTLYNK